MSGSTWVSLSECAAAPRPDCGFKNRALNGVVSARTGERTIGERAARARQLRLCSPDAERGLRADAIVCRAVAGNRHRKRFSDRQSDQHNEAQGNWRDIDAKVRSRPGRDRGFGCTLRRFTHAGADGSLAAGAGFGHGAARLRISIYHYQRCAKSHGRSERQGQGQKDGNDGSERHVQTQDIGLEGARCGVICGKPDICILIGIRLRFWSRLGGLVPAIIPPFIPAQSGSKASVASVSLSRGVGGVGGDERHRSSVVEHSLGKGEVKGSSPFGGFGLRARRSTAHTGRGSRERLSDSYRVASIGRLKLAGVEVGATW